MSDLKTRLESLSKTQKKVLKLFLKHLDTQVIVEEMQCTDGNVRQHLSYIYRALGIDTTRSKHSGLIPLIKLLTTLTPIQEVQEVLEDVGTDMSNTRSAKRENADSQKVETCESDAKSERQDDQEKPELESVEDFTHLIESDLGIDPSV